MPDRSSTEGSVTKLKDVHGGQSSSKLSLQETLGRDRQNDITSHSLIENSILQSKFETNKANQVKEEKTLKEKFSMKVISEEHSIKNSNSMQFSNYQVQKKALVDHGSLSQQFLTNNSMSSLQKKPSSEK